MSIPQTKCCIEMTWKQIVLWPWILGQNTCFTGRVVALHGQRCAQTEWQKVWEVDITMAQISQWKCGTTKTRDTSTNFNGYVISTSRERWLTLYRNSSFKNDIQLFYNVIINNISNSFSKTSLRVRSNLDGQWSKQKFFACWTGYPI
jgi:hypothetical protein